MVARGGMLYPGCGLSSGTGLRGVAMGEGRVGNEAGDVCQGDK